MKLKISQNLPNSSQNNAFKTSEIFQISHKTSLSNFYEFILILRRKTDSKLPLEFEGGSSMAGFQESIQNDRNSPKS